MSTILGVHYPKLKGMKSHPTYVVQGKSGSLFRQACNLPSSEVEQFNLLMSNQICEMLVPTKEKQLFVKNESISVPDVYFDEEPEQLPKTEIQSKNLVKGKTILSYEKQNNKFHQSDRIEIDGIKTIMTWDYTTLGGKKFVMLCVQENRYVKLDDIKQKNPLLLLDFVLTHCIFIK